VSLADIAAVAHLDIMPLSPEGSELLAAAPALEAWLERMTSRSSARNTTMAVLRAAAEPQPA
jgi:glutathione S-transferase